jgi:hypothetical protein
VNSPNDIIPETLNSPNDIIPETLTVKKLIKMGFFIINTYYISSSNDPNITRGSECMGVGRHAIFNLLAVLILKFSNNQ